MGQIIFLASTCMGVQRKKSFPGLRACLYSTRHNIYLYRNEWGADKCCGYNGSVQRVRQISLNDLMAAYVCSPVFDEWLGRKE
jgi:hypothetical protein